ncbi:MAG: ribosome silencing factor [Bacteroidota bacterium]
MTKKARKKRKDNSTLLAESVVNGIQEKKGKEILVLDLRKIENAVSDYFIICEAESITQVEAIARSVAEVVEKERSEKPWHSEGTQNAQWILIDYVSVVVHIFQKEVRQFYNLEALWADAEIMEVEYQY